MIRLAALCCLGVVALSLQAGEVGVRFIDRLPEPGDWRMLDTRPGGQCEKRTIQGARCLAADDLLGHSGRLPSLRDLVWLFGTLGLDGSETVVVAGRPGEARDFVAGVLYLAGQSRVLVLQPPLNQVMNGTALKLGPGQRRGRSRERHFLAVPRDGQIVLRRELQQRLGGARAPRLLDVRSQEEYWGERIRGWRGGHIPGAELASPLSGRRLRSTPAGVDTVVYGYGPLESVAAFTRLQAQWRGPVQVFIDGWRAWSADGGLPVDSASFRDG